MALYNTTRYNEQSFNYLQLNEIVDATDNIVTKDLTTTKFDTAFTNDVLTKQVTEKIISETVDLDHWIQINNKASNTWSD